MVKAKKNVFGKTHPAVIAVWAAIVAGSSVLPSIPLIGTGGTFSLATAIVPLSGVLFGPVGGGIAAAIGGFLGNLLAPHTAWMGMASFTIGVVSAVIAGLVTEGKWIHGILALIIFAVGFILWFSHPIGQSAPLFPIVFYGTGALAVVAGMFLAMKGFVTGTALQKAIVLWLIGYAAMAGSASIANYFALTLFELPRELWMLLTVQAPIERVIFSIATVAIGIPLLVGLPKIGVFVGPQIDEEMEEEEA